MVNSHKSIVGLRVIGVLVVVVMMFSVGWVTNWFGLASPRFVPGVNYKFEYSKKTTYGTGINVIPGRDFQVDETTVFPAPEEGTRGETFLVEDHSLPPNTFRLVEKATPEIRVGDRIFQKRQDYLEVRYHMVTEEPQRLIPHLKPSAR